MTIANTDQAKHWNDTEAISHWLDHQARFDRMLSVFSDMIFGRAQLAPGERVLDVGCGNGATTRDAARVVAPGRTLGVDLSGPMLERARAAAREASITNIDFEQVDVQIHPFEGSSFDAVISRFGIMFFADPVVAFTNLHHATRPGGRLTFVCWQPLTANEWLLVPIGAMAEHLPPPPAPAPSSPGMFALADPDRVRSILTAGGWHDVDVASRHTPMLVGGGGSVEDALDFVRAGSTERAMLAGADPATATRALDAVRDALQPHLGPEGVRLDAAIWLVHAIA